MDFLEYRLMQAKSPTTSPSPGPDEKASLSKSLQTVVPLPVIGDKVLVFSISTLQTLRELGILGVLIGTLPQAPQQNLFLSLPLELSLEEVMWLVTNGHGILVDNLKYNEWALTFAQPPSMILVSDGALEQKLRKLNLPEEVIQQRLPKDPNFVVTQTAYEVPETIPQEVTISLDEFVAGRSHSYDAFAQVKESGYTLLPGLRFGGDFVAYPGDPLRFHSHLVVRALKSGQGVKPLDLVTGGRLATAVKKAWVLSGKVRGEQRAFSVEWLGWG